MRHSLYRVTVRTQVRMGGPRLLLCRVTKKVVMSTRVDGNKEKFGTLSMTRCSKASKTAEREGGGVEANVGFMEENANRYTATTE